MDSRGQLTELLNRLEKDLKELEIGHEHYFLGIEKRAPEPQRVQFARRIRKMLTLHIPQTDLRFRLQGIASRFNSYCGHWDRVQRLIEEGKYPRHTSRIERHGSDLRRESPPPAGALSEDTVEAVYENLVKAHQDCHLRPPNREQVVNFLARQQDTIKQRFGEQAVDYVVVTEEGKPKIRVRSRH